MQFEVAEDVIKRAKAAHELFMVNLGAHLLLGPAGIFLGIGRLGILLPMAVALLFMAYTFRRANGIDREQHPFIFLHWKLALRNYRFLFYGYGLTIVLLLISWLVQSSAAPHSPGQLLSVALTRIGVMPTVIMVFASFVIGNGGLNQALRGEVADKHAQRYLES